MNYLIIGIFSLALFISSAKAQDSSSPTMRPGSPNQGGPGNPNQGGPGSPNQGGPGNPNQGGPGNPNQGGPGNPNQGGLGNPNQYSNQPSVEEESTPSLLPLGNITIDTAALATSTCPFDNISEQVRDLGASARTMLDQVQAAGKGACSEAIDESVVEDVINRYEEAIESTKGARDSSFNLGGFQGQGTAQNSVHCLNYKQTYRQDVMIALSAIRNGLLIDHDNTFFQCNGYPPNQITVCIENTLGGKLAQKEQKCKIEINNEVDSKLAEGLIGLSEDIGSYLSGECSGNNSPTLLRSALNLAIGVTTLSSFAYPGLAAASIGSIIKPLFSKRNKNALEQLKQEDNIKQLQCMYLSLEQSRCTLQVQKDPGISLQSDCSAEEKAGLPREFFHLGNDLRELKSASDTKKFMNLFDQVRSKEPGSGGDFFKELEKVIDHVRRVDRDKIDGELPKDTKRDYEFIQKLSQAYEKYREHLNEHGNSSMAIESFPENVLQNLINEFPPGESPLNPFVYFSTYAKLTLKQEDLPSHTTIDSLSTWEGSQLAGEFMRGLVQKSESDDDDNLNELSNMIAVFSSEAGNFFTDNLERQQGYLTEAFVSSQFKENRKSNQPLGKYQHQTILRQLFPLLRSCKLNASIFYYSQKSSTNLNESFNKSNGFNEGYQKICSIFSPCIGDITQDKPFHDVDLKAQEKFERFVCSNVLSYSPTQIQKEFDTKKTFCGKTLDQIYQSLPKR